MQADQQLQDQQLQDQQLQDKQPLYELMCRYCHAVDRKLFAELSLLYHPDAQHDHGELYNGSAGGFINYLKETMVNMVTQHFIGNHYYQIDGDSAQGEIYTINFHTFEQDDKQCLDYVATGRYLDRYVKDNDGWLIIKRQRVIDWRYQSELYTPAEYTNSASGDAVIGEFIKPLIP